MILITGSVEKIQSDKREVKGTHTIKKVEFIIAHTLPFFFDALTRGFFTLSSHDWAKQSCDKANFGVDYSNANATVGLKMSQAGEGACCKAPGTVNAHVTTAMAGHNLGYNVNYNVGNGNIDHHLKFKLNHGQGYAVVGMKNANDTELLVSQSVGKNLCLGPFGSMNMKNAYAKVNYNLGNGDYGVGLVTEGDYRWVR